MLRVISFVIGVFMAISPLNAATVTNLYNVQVPLADSDRGSEQSARELAFEQVLVKLTGDESILDNEALKKAQSNSSQYVRQLSYGTFDGHRSLNVVFEPAQLQALMTQAQVTLWPQERPLVLVWLVEEQAGRRNIIWDQSPNDAVSMIKNASEWRGIPTLMPVGDFDDQTAVTVPDLWGGFAQPIGVASERYRPESVLVVKNRQRGDEASLEWSLYPNKPAVLQGARPEVIRGSAAGDDSYDRMMAEVASTFAKRYGVPLGVKGSGGLEIMISNIGRLEDLIAIERALTGLSSVASAHLVSMSGTQATYGINLLGDESTFESEWMALPNIGKAFTPTQPEVDVSGAMPTQPVQLRPVYSWQ